MPEDRAGRSPLVRTLAWLAIITAAIFLAQTYQRAYRTSGNDFSTYLAASRAFWSGQNPYEIALPFPYVYPLLLAAAIGPLTLLPYWLAVLLWFVLSVACLVYAVWGTLALAVASNAAMPAPPVMYAAASLAVALHAGIIQNNLLNGQVNLILLALMVATVRGAMSGAQGRSSLGILPLGILPSIGLGASIAIKLTPLVLVPYFALRARWRIVAVGLVVAATLTAIPAFWLGADGPGRAAGFLGAFAGDAFSSPTFRAQQPLTFSLGGVLTILTRMPPLVASGLGVLVAGSVLLAVELLARQTAPGPGAVWMFTAWLVAIPLLSPMSETHHLVLLIPAASLAAAGAVDRRRTASLPWLFGAFAIALVAAQLAKHGIVYVASMFVLIGAVASGLSMNLVRTVRP